MSAPFFDEKRAQRFSSVRPDGRLKGAGAPAILHVVLHFRQSYSSLRHSVYHNPAGPSRARQGRTLVKLPVVLLDQVHKGPGGRSKETVLLIYHGQGAGQRGITHSKEGEAVHIGGAVDAAFRQEGEAHILRYQVDGGGVVGGGENVGGLHALDAEGVVQQLGQPPVLGQHHQPLMLQPAQVPEGQWGGAGAVQPPDQGVVPVGDEEDALIHHQLVAEIGQVAGDVHETKVGDAAGGQAAQLGDRGLVKDHVDVGVLLGKFGKDIGQKGGATPGGHADMQVLPFLGLEIPQVALQLAVQIALALQIGVKQLSGLGELKRGVGAVQQDHAQVGLQLGQVLAEIGLGQVQALGGFGDAAFLDDGKKILRILHKHGGPPGVVIDTSLYR